MRHWFFIKRTKSKPCLQLMKSKSFKDVRVFRWWNSSGKVSKKKCQCHPEKAAIENLKGGENLTGHCCIIWVSFFWIVRLYLYNSYVN